jgi:hypothetical protein
MLRRVFPTVVLLLLLGLAGCEPTNQGYAPDQPIKYSHAVHAGVLSIPCQYCHFGAEKGQFAGIPPSQVCMNCHKNMKSEDPEVLKLKEAHERGEAIKWVRVHLVPDHVYFNHAPHVREGVTCQECHGAVETMGRVEQFAPLTMGWCLDCHRTGGKPQTGEEELPRVDTYLTDCTTCHH